MHNFIHQTQYVAPKWRAYVTPSDNAFRFGEVAVRSLWELKQALLTLPEDVTHEYLQAGKHHVADWVRHIVGDAELAEVLQEQSHRWGALVALERQMMRTLNLPDYVAQRWLETAEIGFTFVSGEEVHSLEELKTAFENISEETIAFHCERQPNDLSVWIGDVIGDYYLAEALEETQSKTAMEQLLSDHLTMLHEAVE